MKKFSHTRSAPVVALLISVYNGAQFLMDLIDSLISQIYENVVIYVRDDGSTDNSLDFLLDLEKRNVIVLLKDDEGNLGSAKSFIHMLFAVEADYYMFCDQDDLWLPEKVLNAVECMGSYSKDERVVYITDLVVVDNELNVLSESFFDIENIKMPMALSFSIMLVQNCAVGCTMAINSGMKAYLKSRDGVRDWVAMHDWWIAMEAVCFGIVHVGEGADILYRQHGGNVSGVSYANRLKKISMLFDRLRINRILDYKIRIATQARGFYSISCGKLSKKYNFQIKLVSMLDSKYSFLFGCYV